VLIWNRLSFAWLLLFGFSWLACLLPGVVLADEIADVVVFGATPGGFCAAIAASREGAKVLLVEPTGHVGGEPGGRKIGTAKLIAGVESMIRIGNENAGGFVIVDALVVMPVGE
jgi:ribulose 1,5-bisphosphate synthetase/thiazole synthase